jgi:1,4-alpha-glucan branching enzyme
MFGPARRKGTTRFALRPPPGAAKVQLAGDFTGWSLRAMRRGKDGTFAANVQLPRGLYEYKFLVDGQWALDPDNATVASNPFGSFNSVAEVT